METSSAGGSRTRSKRIGTKRANSKNVKTNKIISRLTYNPVKAQAAVHQKIEREAQELHSCPQLCPIVTTTLGVGSDNIHGLDMEATWAAQQLLDSYTLDVSDSGNHLMCIYDSCYQRNPSER